MDNLTKWITELKKITDETKEKPFVSDPFDYSVKMKYEDLKEIRELLIDYLILKNEK